MAGQRFWISESNWMGASGGKVQFVAMENSFTISQYTAVAPKEGESTPTVALSTFTAIRKGAPQTGNTKSSEEIKKRSMLQRWGPYLGTALAYLTYKVVVKQGKRDK